MPVPQQRNKKKSRRMVHRNPSPGAKRLLRDDEYYGDGSGDDDVVGSIEDMRGPGSWLENEYLENNFERNMFEIAASHEFMGGISAIGSSFLREPTFDEGDGDDSDFENVEDYF